MQVINKSSLKKTRSRLRRNMPLPEVLLWQKLRGRATGYKFRRQYSVLNYILDFYSPELKLAIEIDGESHYADIAIQKQDAKRDLALKKQGICVVRFTNREVMDGVENVVSEVMENLPPRTPPYHGGE